MRQTVLVELHDAKLKMINAINAGDKELANKYQDVIRDLERLAEMLNK